MRQALAAISLFLAACAPMEWYRPDMSAGDTEQDAKQCQDAAWRASWDYAYGYGPWPYWGPYGRRYWGPWGSPYNDRFIAEARMADLCMEAKGYRLESTR